MNTNYRMQSPATIIFQALVYKRVMAELMIKNPILLSPDEDEEEGGGGNEENGEENPIPKAPAELSDHDPQEETGATPDMGSEPAE